MNEPKLCGCIGPQNGQPLCPCAMKTVMIVRGRYIRPAQDLGPVEVALVGSAKELFDEVMRKEQP